MLAHTMQVLGLTAAEEDVYRHLLRNPGAEPDDLHILLRCAPEETDSALRRFRELGLLREDGGSVSARAPEVVVGRLAEQRLEELYDSIRTLSHLQPIIDSLADEVPAEEADPADGPTERLTDIADIRTRLDELSFFARSEVQSAEPYDALTPENIAHARPLDMRCLRRGVAIRNLVRAAALTDPATLSYLRELSAAGARIRVLDTLDELILIYDRHTALVPIDPADTAKGALCSRERGIVTTIINNFERLWSAAEDFETAVGQDRTGEEAVSELQLRVLEAMCTVAKDETGARKLGISLRTYRRHVSELFQTLGAENRAHAALLARERGWV
nr:helix-turn-helix transcriptional regulator [Streptomyces sp. 130]